MTRVPVTFAARPVPSSVYARPEVSDSRRLVYVSGAPGSGKTSLAVPLAAELGYALLAKDRIKETLHDALGAPEPDRAWSRKLGGAAMELLWALAADAPTARSESAPSSPWTPPSGST
jgi:adenylylsulfate kinase-like enzyme